LGEPRVKLVGFTKEEAPKTSASSTYFQSKIGEESLGCRLMRGRNDMNTFGGLRKIAPIFALCDK